MHKSMTIAITGGSGFIGNRLVQRLSLTNHKIRLLTRKNKPNRNSSSQIEIFQGDLRQFNRDLCSFVDGADLLFNCAGETQVEDQMESVHILGTKNLIKAASGTIKHWIQLSSVGVYGRVKEGIVSENNRLSPVGKYEITKTESDNLVMQAHANGDFNLSILRPSNVFGPEMTRQYIFKIISLIESNLFFFMHKNSIISNIHVENVVEALYLCAQNPNPQKADVFILSDELPLTEYIGFLVSELKTKMPWIYIPEKFVRLVAHPVDRLSGSRTFSKKIDALTSQVVYDSTLIKDALGYRHVKSLYEGLQEMVSAYKQRSKFLKTGHL